MLPASRTKVETIASSLPVSGALAATAAYAATPLAALLPVLGQTLAAERQRRRIEQEIAEISESLERQEEKLKHLTDEQYKLVNETILALLQTTSIEKISLLKTAISNGIDIQVEPLEATFLSRVIRDISPKEVSFLAKNFQYQRVQVCEAQVEHEIPTLTVHPDSQDGRVVVGLIQLGLLMPAEPTWDDSGLLRYSPFAAKVLAFVSAAR